LVYPILRCRRGKGKAFCGLGSKAKITGFLFHRFLREKRGGGKKKGGKKRTVVPPRSLGGMGGGGGAYAPVWLVNRRGRGGKKKRAVPVLGRVGRERKKKHMPVRRVSPPERKPLGVERGGAVKRGKKKISPPPGEKKGKEVE